MQHDAIIVGGGIAGLTSAAFLCKSGRNVLLCEKENNVGGLIGSFDYNGFTFDAGIRAMENSGVLLPMLKKLGLDIEFIKNKVSIGIEDNIVDLTSEESLSDYQDMLNKSFPDDQEAISEIIKIIKKTIDYMHILYGIDNPLFLDIKEDREYFIKTILPWMFKYMTTAGKIKRLDSPVEAYLQKITDNQVLIDMIAQHFFKNTPSFFALSYFSLYLDYNYPKGGTGTLVSAMEQYIKEHGGIIKSGTLIESVDPVKKSVTDSSGNVYAYSELIWAADIKALYNSVDDGKMSGESGKKIKSRRSLLQDKTGGDSVLTLYIAAEIDKSYFGNISNAHFFYTPLKQGLNSLPVDMIQHEKEYSKDKDTVLDWVREFLRLTTFEISIPVLRDETLAPEGKTGLIISTLFDYPLVKHIEEMGWYDAFKSVCREAIVASLSGSVYPELAQHEIDAFVSTPLTLQRRTGNTDGAITGWAFTNEVIPAVSSIPSIAKSVKTPIPHVVQAGQWTYSPSGLPISIITGKLAADSVGKKLRR